jgi:hypothetical protein
MTTYKLYLTVELPGSYDTKDVAMDAAVEALQDAVEKYVAEPDLLLKPIEMRVFAEGKALSGEQHDFVVDILDGAI